MKEKSPWKTEKTARHNRSSQGEPQKGDSASRPFAVPSPLCSGLLQYFFSLILGTPITETKSIHCSSGELTWPGSGAGVLIPLACRTAQCAIECVSTMATAVELQEFDFHGAPGPCLTSSLFQSKINK